jgi:hypothetical protein
MWASKDPTSKQNGLTFPLHSLAFEGVRAPRRRRQVIYPPANMAKSLLLLHCRLPIVSLQIYLAMNVMYMCRWAGTNVGLPVH